MSEVYFGEVCVLCRAGLHRLCSDPGVDDVCCCRGEYVLEDHLRSIEIDEAIHRARIEAEEELQERLLIADNADRLAPAPKKKGEVTVAPDATTRELGESGYIDSAAWNSTAHIGTLSDPRSTGRKRAAKMYPIEPGMVCEWARKKDCGGGVLPILGCMGNPASDLHHGPDKNTLNNAKKSRNIGNLENMHLICSDCHNLWHALNDPFYPPYDRVADQDKPWLPDSQGRPWGPQEPTDASFEELVEQEKYREQQRLERGRDYRGRNATARKVGDGPELIDDGDEPYEPDPDDPRLD